MEARPADLVLVDERDLEAELRRAEGRGVPAGARAEHDEIEVVGGADGHGSGGPRYVPGRLLGHLAHAAWQAVSIAVDGTRGPHGVANEAVRPVRLRTRRAGAAQPRVLDSRPGTARASDATQEEPPWSMRAGDPLRRPGRPRVPLRLDPVRGARRAAVGRPGSAQPGSGRTGGTNALRALGRRRAAVVVAGDLLKGAVPVLVARALTGSAAVEVLCGLAAVLGASRSIFLGFHGGRGVGTGVGTMLVIQPWAVLLATPVFIVVILLTRYVSLGSLLGSAAMVLFVVACSCSRTGTSRWPTRCTRPSGAR